MDRGQRYQAQRRILAVAIGISAGVHIAALAWVKLSVPTFEDGQEQRALQVLELPDQWDRSAIEVVPLETVVSSALSGALDGASATSAQVDLPEPGAAGAEAAVAAIVPLSELSGAAPNEPVIAMALAEAAPVVEVTFARANRGVIKRSASGGAGGSSGFDFIATSDAARDAERARGGGGSGGPGGIGVGVIGGGGHCPTWGGVPFVDPTGGRRGGVPTMGPGMGIIGARPPTAEAINRFGPRIGGGR
jgi:hypothetical protein